MGCRHRRRRRCWGRCCSRSCRRGTGDRPRPYTYAYNSFHYGKREAEADPALIYSSGYHYPTVYSGLSHGVYNTHYTTPYVYGGIHHLGKREAEADPALVYSSGYHYPTVYS